jgi:hypothetical protein
MIKKLPRITGLEFLGDYRVRLAFSDGFAGALDLRPILAGELFQPLKDPAFFRQAAIQHGTLIWPNDADLCPDVLRYWCEIGRVCSQTELDAAFTSEGRHSAIMLNDKQNS